MSTFDFSTFISPFTWRYGSSEMRKIFSEEYKYKLWRTIWVALAKAQYKVGLLNKKEFDDIEKNQNNINIEEILRIEKETRHDVVAAIKEFSNKTTIGKGKIHLGATSMDIVDNADMLRIKEALALIETKIKKVLLLFSEKIKQYANLPCIGYTHLQPAEPTTVGYRLAFYAQDLLITLKFLDFAKDIIRAKGMKGAVGTSATYHSLLKGNKLTALKLEKQMEHELGIKTVLISSQVYPRLFDYIILSVLASVTAAAAKFAGDLRLLQSPNIGEWSEPFGKKQVGSSAMPFKKNPMNSENICSLARFVSHLPNIALENATLSYLERTLDDSANKRLIVPEAFLAADQIFTTFEKIISGLFINEKRIALNLNLYAPFAATETILMQCVKKGADRQELHETIREISLIAWQSIQDGKPNPMKDLLINSLHIQKFLTKEEIFKLFDVKNYIGDAPIRAETLAKKIRSL